MPWAPVTTVSPHDSLTVEIDSPVAGRRVRVDRDALAALVLRADEGGDLRQELRVRGLIHAPEWDAGLAEGIAHWASHAWDLSLSYYLWSRRASFADEGPTAQETRAQVLRRMIADAPVPQQRVPTGKIALRISDGNPRSEDMSLGRSLEDRRSQLTFSGRPFDRAELAVLLGRGLRRFIRSRGASADTADVSNLLVSFGSAIDVYVLVYECNNLDRGVYVLEPLGGTLHVVRSEDIRVEARAALLAHPDPAGAGATIVLVADYQRYQWRYRHERALRSLWIDAGRMLQELLMVAVSMRMKVGITPAVADGAFAALLGFEPSECQVLHTLTFAADSSSGRSRSAASDNGERL